MRFPRWIVLASLAFFAVTAASAFESTVGGTAVFPLSIIDKRPFVGVKIDDKGPFSFILDTGSSSTTLSAALAQKLGLPQVDAGTGTGAGEQAVSYRVVHLNDLSLGPFSIGALDAPAIDTGRLSQVMGFQSFDGVLGAEIFPHHVLTLDAAQRQLTIQDPAQFKPPVNAIRIPFWLDENQMPMIDASVAGTKGVFQIDTGDRFGLTLFGAFWRAHEMNEKLGTTVEAMTGYGDGGPIHSIVGRSADFSIGGVTVPPPVTRLSLQKAGAFTQTDRAGSIGMAILKRFRISFDYDHHQMWLSKSAAFDAPDRYDRSGMWLGLSVQHGLQVIDVVGHGPAADAGIQTGDQIEKVGTLLANASTLSEIRSVLQDSQTSIIPILVRRPGGDREIRLALRDLISP